MLIPFALIAQNNCTVLIDFENEISNNAIVFNNSITYSNPVSNWRINPGGVVYDFARELNGNIFLIANDRGGGPSWLSNVADFTGNLLPENTCSATFCFDIKYLNTGGNPNNFINSIYFFSPNNGTNINTASSIAVFQFFTPIAVNANLWTNVCIPITRCTGTVLPSNSVGQWLSSSISDCNNWNSFLSNISGIAFNTDINNANGNSTPGEVWGFDNFCYSQIPCPPIPFPNCCDKKLEIIETTKEPIQNFPTGFNGSDPFSVIRQEYKLTQNSVIPITEFRAAVTDIEFNYDYDACATCVDNPALWGSITGSFELGGKLTNDYGENILQKRINNREIIWSNPNGAMLTANDNFYIDFALPLVSEIPCCATSVTICMDFTYKDANCKVCVEPICITLDLSDASKKIGSLEIDVKKKGCCERTLTAETDVYATYLWNTGETTKEINVDNNGTYTVTATAAGVSVTKNIIIGDILKGNFPLLSFNSVFHPDNNDPYWEPHCFCLSTFLGICVKWSGCWKPGQFKKRFYIMDVSPGKVIQGVPNSYNANEYKLEVWHRWNTQGGQGETLKTITGISDTCTGFNNWDIFWDGTDLNGNSLKDEKSDAYVWRLTLKNCNNQSSNLTYKTTFNPDCGPCTKWRKFLWWNRCVEHEGCWNTETFEFGDVELTK